TARRAQTLPLSIDLPHEPSRTRLGTRVRLVLLRLLARASPRFTPKQRKLAEALPSSEQMSNYSLAQSMSMSSDMLARQIKLVTKKLRAAARESGGGAATYHPQAQCLPSRPAR